MTELSKKLFVRIAGVLLAVMLFAAGTPFCTYTAYAAEVPSRKQVEASGLPVLDITLDGYGEDDIHRSAWQPAYCRLDMKGEVLETGAQIKGRGNYTWAQEKRPYAIKLDVKQKWFGFSGARDWVLLADYTDETHLRNYFAFTLASGFRFSFTPKVQHAHVYINGEYKGLYLIAEKVEIDDKRVDIDVTRGDLLLELDNNYGYSEPEQISTPMGNLLVVKDPDSEEYRMKAEEAGSKLSFAAAKRFVKKCISAFENGLLENAPLEELGNYIDLTSLVDWYIFNEIMKNDDSVFNSSVYLYSRFDDKLYMGPVWDYDISLAGIDRYTNLDSTGLQYLDNPWERQGNWFLYLLNRDDFVSMVKARWTELYGSTLFSDSLKKLNDTASAIRKDVSYDYALYDNRGVFVNMADYSEACNYLMNYITERITWLNSEWGDGSSGELHYETPKPEATQEPEPTPGEPEITEAPKDQTPGPEVTAEPFPQNEDAPTWPALIIASVVSFALGAGAAVLVMIIVKKQRTKKENSPEDKA